MVSFEIRGYAWSPKLNNVKKGIAIFSSITIVRHELLKKKLIRQPSSSASRKKHTPFMHTAFEKKAWPRTSELEGLRNMASSSL
jgi:hypothetical protein